MRDEARKPEFITFTGVDDRTDLDRLVALSARYPTEWGMLFSPKRQGDDPRYPSGRMQSRFLHLTGVRIAAHLCGGWANAVMEGGSLVSLPVNLGHFDRVQVNHPSPIPSKMQRLRDDWWFGRCIGQCRGAFPSFAGIDWLADASGGRGVSPESWPPHPGGIRLVGYAGGIGPDNVAEVVTKINSAGRFWIDMESGVRTDNWLDLDKCEAVCRAVYGDGILPIVAQG